MTHIFQPLDLTINKWVKEFFKKKFNEWYASRLREELEKGKSLDEIEIKFTLTELKPIHANWLIECYNSLTSPENQGAILAGWRASGISEALAVGSVSFYAAMDPFHDIDPFATGIQEDFAHEKLVAASGEYISESKSSQGDESDSDCELDLR